MRKWIHKDISDIKVTVIVPVYNVENYLRKCMESIICQSHENLQIIVVDDGSTDKSASICDEYAKRDRRVKVIHKENGGLSSARNAALDILEGDSIIFVDSDDWLPLDAVRFLVEMLVESDAEIVEGRLGYAESDENISANLTYNCTGRIALEKDIVSTTAPGKMYCASLWRGVRFREGIIHEDYHLMYKVIYNANKYFYTNRVVYYINERIGSITRSGYSDKQLVLLEIDEERIVFFRDREEYALLEHAYTDFYNHLLTLFNESGYKWILKKYRKNIKWFMQIKRISLKTKMKLLACYIYPKLWKC